MQVDRIPIRAIPTRAPNPVRMDRLVAAMVSEGYFANLQDFRDGWHIISNTPPPLASALAARHRLTLGPRLRCGFGWCYPIS